MKRFALSTLVCAAMACGLWVNAAPSAPPIEVPRAAVIEAPSEAAIGLPLGNFWCEYWCNGQGATGHLMACAEATLKDCCRVAKGTCSNGFDRGTCEDRTNNTVVNC